MKVKEIIEVLSNFDDDVDVAIPTIVRNDVGRIFDSVIVNKISGHISLSNQKYILLDSYLENNEDECLGIY